MTTFNVSYNITELPKIISRIWFNNPIHPDVRRPQSTRTIEVTDLSQEYCQEELVYVKAASDILSPIKFQVKYTLEDDQKFHSPILNTTSLKEFEANFQKDCGDDDVCDSYLYLTAGTNGKRKFSVVVIDSIKNLSKVLLCLYNSTTQTFYRNIGCINFE